MQDRRIFNTNQAVAKRLPTIARKARQKSAEQVKNPGQEGPALVSPRRGVQAARSS